MDRSGAEWYDLIVLRSDPSILQSLLELSEDKLGSWYDNLSALRQWLWLSNTFDDRYNCVELVTQSIFFDENKKVPFYDNWKYSFLWKFDENIRNIYVESMKSDVHKIKSKAHPNDLFEYQNLLVPIYLWHISK